MKNKVLLFVMFVMVPGIVLPAAKSSTDKMATQKRRLSGGESNPHYLKRLREEAPEHTESEEAKTESKVHESGSKSTATGIGKVRTMLKARRKGKEDTTKSASRLPENPLDWDKGPGPKPLVREFEDSWEPKPESTISLKSEALFVPGLTVPKSSLLKPGFPSLAQPGLSSDLSDGDLSGVEFESDQAIDLVKNYTKRFAIKESIAEKIVFSEILLANPERWDESFEDQLITNKEIGTGIELQSKVKDICMRLVDLKNQKSLQAQERDVSKEHLRKAHISGLDQLNDMMKNMTIFDFMTTKAKK
jgi:hypothetical protein